jgi:hypothetical protein
MSQKDKDKRRAYNKLYQIEWERLNPVKRRQYNNARLTRIKAFLLEYKQSHPCMHCGESHPGCLDFHHRNPDEKELALAEAVQRSWGIKRITVELAKCDVLCANCHRKHHWEERVKATSEADAAYRVVEPDLEPMNTAKPNISIWGQRTGVPRRIQTPEGTAWCSACKQGLPLDQFHPRNGRWNGVNNNCKKCAATRKRERRAAKDAA